MTNKSTYFKYQKGNLDVAYLIGIYLSKGRLNRDTSQLEVTTLDLEVCDRIAKAAFSLFGIRSEIKQKNKFFQVHIPNKSLCLWLTGSTENKSSLPKCVFGESREWQKELLSGIFDGDGFYALSQDRMQNAPTVHWFFKIAINTSKYNYVAGLPKLLDSMGIKYYYKKNFDKFGKLTGIELDIDPESYIRNGLFCYSARKQERVGIVGDYLMERSTTARPAGTNLYQKIQSGLYGNI